MSCDAPLTAPASSADSTPASDAVAGASTDASTAPTNPPAGSTPRPAGGTSPAPAPDAAAGVDAVPATQMLIETVQAWSGVGLAPHRYQAVAFQIDDKEFGHLHASGLLDVPFPRPLRDALVEDGLASVHRYVPDSGWVTFCVDTAADVDHAAYLLRLSFLYRSLVRARTAGDRARIRAEFDDRGVTGALREVFDVLLDRRATSGAGSELPSGMTPRTAPPAHTRT